MPKKYYEDEEDPNIQEWSTVVIKKEVIHKDIVNYNHDQFIKNMIQKREELKLSQIQLNVKCKFPYKYTIRDIESKRVEGTLLELKTIASVLEIK
jgi:hypothetical protein